jgi:cysteinyl-tRNA synthetase
VAADGRKGPLKARSLPKSIPVEEGAACKYSVKEIQEMVERRTLMRRAHQFEEADEIRDDLASNGESVS